MSSFRSSQGGFVALLAAVVLLASPSARGLGTEALVPAAPAPAAQATGAGAEVGDPGADEVALAPAGDGAAVVEPAGDPGARPEPGDEAWLEDEDWLDGDYHDPAESDPLEGSNRAVFVANEALYRWILDPVTDVYQFVVPSPARRSVLRFFSNLGEPATLVNELAQLNPKRAGITGTRFLLNTTVGVAGFFDPAGAWGFRANDTDFGETLGVYGVGSGWYLVVPVLGPSSVRDLVGSVVDSLLHPTVYLVGATPAVLLAGGGGVSRYDAQRVELEAMRASSVDFYAALRGAYIMHREAGVLNARDDSLVWGRGDAQEPVSASASAIFASTLARSASKPSFLSTPAYSERRSASSLTVPLR